MAVGSGSQWFGWAGKECEDVLYQMWRVWGFGVVAGELGTQRYLVLVWCALLSYNIFCVRLLYSNCIGWMLCQWWYWGYMHFLLGTGTILLGWGLAVSILWHCGLCQNIASGFVSLLLNNPRYVPCWQGLMACWGTGWSCCTEFLGAKACYGQ